MRFHRREEKSVSIDLETIARAIKFEKAINHTKQIRPDSCASFCGSIFVCRQSWPKSISQCCRTNLNENFAATFVSSSVCRLRMVIVSCYLQHLPLYRIRCCMYLCNVVERVSHYLSIHVVYMCICVYVRSILMCYVRLM